MLSTYLIDINKSSINTILLKYELIHGLRISFLFKGIAEYMNDGCLVEVMIPETATRHFAGIKGKQIECLICVTRRVVSHNLRLIRMSYASFLKWHFWYQFQLARTSCTSLSLRSFPSSFSCLLILPVYSLVIKLTLFIELFELAFSCITDFI